MVATKILVDSVTYFRLAKSIHPLLKIEFGTKRYILMITDETRKEYNNSPRLNTKFPWFNEIQYKENRKCQWSLSKSKKELIDETYRHILEADYKNDLSKIDILCLAYGEVLNIIVATDDEYMLEIAKLFDIKTLKTIELIKLMFVSKHIDINQVIATAEFIIYMKDEPKNFRKDFTKLFQIAVPQ